MKTPLEFLEMLREAAVRQRVENLAAQVDWAKMPKTNRPPQHWFNDDANPFLAED